MNSRKPLLALLLAILIGAAIAALIPSPAQAQCGVPGAPACPPREKKTRTPTRVPPTKTPTPTPTPAGIPLTGGDGGGAVPGGIGGTPSVQLRAFSPNTFLIGLLLLLLLGGVFAGRYILASPRHHTSPLGRNDGKLQQFDQGPGPTDPADYVVWRKNDPLPRPGTTGEGELGGGDVAVNTDPQSADQGAPWGSSYDPPIDDSLNYNWEQSGNIDSNSDGAETADSGDSSSSARKPPDGS